MSWRARVRRRTRWPRPMVRRQGRRVAARPARPLGGAGDHGPIKEEGGFWWCGACDRRVRTTRPWRTWRRMPCNPPAVAPHKPVGGQANRAVGRGRAARTQHELRVVGDRTQCVLCGRSCRTRWRAQLGSVCKAARRLGEDADGTEGRQGQGGEGGPVEAGRDLLQGDVGASADVGQGLGGARPSGVGLGGDAGALLSSGQGGGGPNAGVGCQAWAWCLPEGQCGGGGVGEAWTLVLVTPRQGLVLPEVWSRGPRVLLRGLAAAGEPAKGLGPAWPPTCCRKKAAGLPAPVRGAGSAPGRGSALGSPSALARGRLLLRRRLRRLGGERGLAGLCWLCWLSSRLLSCRCCAVN